MHNTTQPQRNTQHNQFDLRNRHSRAKGVRDGASSHLGKVDERLGTILVHVASGRGAGGGAGEGDGDGDAAGVGVGGGDGHGGDGFGVVGEVVDEVGVACAV